MCVHSLLDMASSDGAACADQALVADDVLSLQEPTPNRPCQPKLGQLLCYTQPPVF